MICCDATAILYIYVETAHDSIFQRRYSNIVVPYVHTHYKKNVRIRICVYETFNTYGMTTVVAR
jgi:hypothetical protein